MLTQTEADTLIAMRNIYVNPGTVSIPPGCDQTHKLVIEAYITWLREGLSVAQLENACELTTPFLDRHNDHIQIYVIKKNGKIVLSDDGYILSDLRTSGLDMNTPKRKGVLESVLNGFGVKYEGNQLFVEASQRNIGQRLHILVQAMLAVNDMFVMAQPRVATFFLGKTFGLFSTIMK